jgi:RimJ/RimL family protein N-acetyltransferase
MRMALRTLIGHAFGTLGLRRLEADVDPRNERSLHALEALGFRREGLLRERWLVEGEIQDSVLLGLLRSEWQAPA